MLHKTLFTIDGFEAIFEGYTDGSYWNGWACPWFTKEVGLKIAKLNNEVNNIDYFMAYNERTDSFIKLNDDEPEIFQGQDIDGMHLYPIGNACWVWDDIADYQSEQSKKLMAYLQEEYPYLNCKKLYDVYYGVIQEIDGYMTDKQVKIFADGFMVGYDWRN